MHKCSRRFAHPSLTCDLYKNERLLQRLPACNMLTLQVDDESWKVFTILVLHTVSSMCWPGWRSEQSICTGCKPKEFCHSKVATFSPIEPYRIQMQAGSRKTVRMTLIDPKKWHNRSQVIVLCPSNIEINRIQYLPKRRSCYVAVLPAGLQI